MEEVYNLHQHEHCVAIQLESRGKINWQIGSNVLAKKYGSYPNDATTDHLMYDEQNMEIVFWKCPSYASDPKEQLESNRSCKNEHYITINNFIDKLYCAFKKGRSYWDENDLILELVVSNFIRVLVNFIIDNYNGVSIHNLDMLNYVCIVPYEWDDEIREELVRPIFIQSGLIAKTDHKDRLLFLSDAESFFYRNQCNNDSLPQLRNDYHKVGDHYLLCEVVVYHKKKSSIHVHLIEAQYPVLNIPEGLLYPKILFSSTLSFTVDSIKNKWKNFLREKLSTDDNNSYKTDYVDMIVTYLYKNIEKRLDLFKESDYKDIAILMNPWIEVKREWKLDETQSRYLETLSLFDICLEIDKDMINVIKNGLFTNRQMKQCKVLIFHEERHIVKDTLISLWSAAILEYIANSLNYLDINITRLNSCFGTLTYKALAGAQCYVGDLVRNSDFNSKPHILPTIEPDISSSVFLEHKINAVLNIDILPDYTLLSYAFVNSDGITEKVLDNHYFTKNKYLPPLKLFYPLSKVTTLVMNERCIPLIDKHLNCMFDPDYYFQKTKKLAIEFGDILNKGFSSQEILISTQDPKYIEAFMLLYFGYINEIVLSGLYTEQPNVDNTRTRIGYLVSMEKRLLNSIVGTKKHLKELVFESGLVKNNDEYKKLRIITQGEGLLPAIQKQIKLELPIKSCFVLAQLHENHVQLTLNQVVTDIGLGDDEAQEAIVLQDKIVSIENMYETLCINMWSNITQNTNLVQFCYLHCENDETLFTLISKNKFTESLREFISTKIFIGDISFQMDTVRRIELSHTCSCTVNLSARDILDISIKPFLCEIASIISGSSINRDYFGNYNEIENIFSIIHFNRNHQFQPILADLLEKEINDFNERQQNVDTYSLVLLDVPNQLLQPVVHKKLAVYKSFQVGDLKQISSFNYGFSVSQSTNIGGMPKAMYRDKRHHPRTTFEPSTGFIFLKKGDAINDTIANRVIYLTVQSRTIITSTYKIESLDGLTSNGTLLIKENTDVTINNYDIRTDFNPKKPEKKEIPLMVFAETRSYSSSLSFSARIIGEEAKQSDMEVGIPMTLTRF